MYSEIVMEHFRNPRNVGSMENADGGQLPSFPFQSARVRSDVHLCIWQIYVQLLQTEVTISRRTLSRTQKK